MLTSVEASCRVSGNNMELPNLPRRNKREEAKFGLIFRRWWEKNPRRGTFELKDTRGKNYLSFSEVKDAQIRYGRLVSSKKGVLIRLEPTIEGIPDYGGYREDPAYIVIRYPKFFCLISIETFLLEKSRFSVGPLTAARARDIAVLVVEL